MSENDPKFAVEEVAEVNAPRRARVDDIPEPAETPAEKLERKRDYLEGFLAAKPEGVSAGEPGGDIYEGVVSALKEIFDPEIPVNIYDLGLIYDIVVEPSGAVTIRMTLTAPACPIADALLWQVDKTVRAVPGVTDVTVNLVWDPPWNRSMMSESAKIQLGLS